MHTASSPCVGQQHQFSFSALVWCSMVLCESVTVVGRCFGLCVEWLGLQSLLGSAPAWADPAALGWPVPELRQK